MKQSLTHYIMAGQPALFFTTHEEARALALWKDVCRDARPSDGKPFELFVWSASRGLSSTEPVKMRDDGSPDTQDQWCKGELTLPKDGSRIEMPVAADPFAVLGAFAGLPGTDFPPDHEAHGRSVLLLMDFHLHLTDPPPLLIRGLKDAIMLAKASNRVLVFVGCRPVLPPELLREVVTVDLKLPTQEELRPIAEGIAVSAGIHLNGNTEKILLAGAGMTGVEFENACALSYIQTKGSATGPELSPRIISREKANALKKGGILEVIETGISFADIGGMEEALSYISKRKGAFSAEARAYGLPTPKGALLVGVPGCGKSLTCKAIGNALDAPLLKLDAGKIFASHVGESEANLRSALQTAEAIGQCVLWVDEIEKGFSGSKSSGQTDGGTAARVFGTWLQWMQDKTAPVYVVATANDVSALPPEFLRKGRWDEIFFIDLPSTEERMAIWAVQIRKYGRAVENYDLRELANATVEFTGSEIEAVYQDALYEAFAVSVEPDTALIVRLSRAFTPLSRMAAEQVNGLRKWAEGRARRANGTAAVPRIAATGRKMA